MRTARKLTHNRWPVELQSGNYMIFHDQWDNGEG
jgi:hypothetical protein